jgi:hypothetical protein
MQSIKISSYLIKWCVHSLAFMNDFIGFFSRLFVNQGLKFVDAVLKTRVQSETLKISIRKLQ